MNEEVESTTEDVLYTLPDSLSDVVAESQDEGYVNGYGELVSYAENTQAQETEVETSSTYTVALLSSSANNTSSYTGSVTINLDSSLYNVWRVTVTNDLFSGETLYLWLPEDVDTIHDYDGYLFNTGSSTVIGLLTSSVSFDTSSDEVYQIVFPSLTSDDLVSSVAVLGQSNYMVCTYINSSDEVVSDYYGSVIEVVEAPAIGSELSSYQVAVIALLVLSVLFGFVGGLLKR